MQNSQRDVRVGESERDKQKNPEINSKGRRLAVDQEKRASRGVFEKKNLKGEAHKRQNEKVK